MKNKIIILVLIVFVAFIFFISGFRYGFNVSNDAITSLLLEDKTEIRQGKLAGAMISLTENETLSEQWEELCSDIIRNVSKAYDIK